MQICFAAIAVGYSKVRDRFGGMGRFTGGLKCKGWVNSITINVITGVITCRYLKKYNYNVKTCVYTNKCIVSNY